MTPTLRPRRPAFGVACRRLAMLLAFIAADPVLRAAPAHAQDEERKAVKLSEMEAQAAMSQSDEFRQKAEVARMDAINRLKALLAEAPQGDRKAEMMLRLSNLYFEQGRAKYFEEMAAYQKEYDDCFRTAENADTCDKIKLQSDTSRTWFSSTIKLYEAILKSYPRYTRADEATYYLGMTYQEVGEREDAKEAFTKLVKLYPTSNFVPDAFVLIGEYYFDKNDAFPALRAYLKATSYRDSERWPYAMYKLAWCYYNVEEYAKAIDTMKAVVAHSMNESSDAAQQSLQLGEEALKDLVRFFADAGELDEAYAYFTKLGRKGLIRSMLQRLATLYFEQGKWDQSIETYRRLIMEAPQHPENPEYQQEIISAYRKMGQRDRVIDEIRRLRTEYGKQSAWWRANASDPEAQTEADATIEKALRVVATDFNREARDLKKAGHKRAGEAFDSAIEAYYVYLEDYADHAKAYAVHYDFGELLYMLKRYDEAYREYMKVVAIDPNGEHSRFCAESAIFAAEEMVKKEGGGNISMKAEKVSKETPPQPLTDWEKNLIASARQYAQLYPKDAKVEQAIYKTAFLLYSRFHFTEAAEQFRVVIAMSPTSKNAEFSANLILDALKIREEYASLRDTAKAFYQQEGLGSKTFKKEMYTIWSSAAFTVIENDFAANKDYVKTAKEYVAFYREFPDFDKVDFALNNAAAYYYQAKRVADAMEIRHILVDDPQFGPKTRFYYRQVAALGYDYERLANLEEATRFYDKLLELYPAERKKLVDDKDAKDKETKLAEMDAQAADALYTSAVFSNALGDWEGAVTRYTAFLTTFPADERALDTRLRIGRIFEEHKAWSRAAEAFKAFYTKDAPDAAPEYAFFARLHHGRALREQGDDRGARDVFDASVKLFDKLTAAGLAPGAHTEFVAEMKYRLAEPTAEAYLKMRIEAAPPRTPQKREDKIMKDSLQAKTRKLVEVEKLYTDIIQTGAGEWGLAAVVALGRAYEDFATTLTESPVPSYLTKDQTDIYRMTLEDKAYVQVEKAVEAYKVALDKSYELNLYNDRTAYATRRLGELRPDDYPGLAEEIPQAGFVSDKVRTFEPATSL